MRLETVGDMVNKYKNRLGKECLKFNREVWEIYIHGSRQKKFQDRVVQESNVSRARQGGVEGRLCGGRNGLLVTHPSCSCHGPC